MAKTDRSWEILQDMNRKLDQHAEALATLIAESKHAKELAAELRERAHDVEKRISAVRLTMARWAGIGAGVVGLVEIFAHVVK